MREHINLTEIGTLLLFLSSNIYATVWYVHPDSTLNRIQLALGYCANNDTVLVAPGVYYEDISWPNTQGIHLLSEYGADTTIIDGGGTIMQVIYIVVPVDSTTIISGFTIRNGYQATGGGVFFAFCSPTITNTIITDNSTDSQGAGIFCLQASPIIRGNTITTNTAGTWGGGICCLEGSEPTIVNNTIMNNTADMTGGGIFCSNSSPIIIGNTIKLNVAAQTGGGIACWWSSSTIKDNIITRNIVGEHGGGIYCSRSSPVIDSCAITSNIGDGVYCEFSSNPVISYNDIVDNTGYGVLNIDSTVVVNAEYNWWGDSTGPYHPDSNPGGQGDTVSDYVDFIPWLYWPGVEENPLVKPVKKYESIGATIFAGPLQLPEGKKCKVYDVTGRSVVPDKIRPGIYFIEIDGEITKKVIKIR